MKKLKWMVIRFAVRNQPKQRKTHQNKMLYYYLVKVKWQENNVSQTKNWWSEGDNGF